MSRFSARLWCQVFCAGGLFFAATTNTQACLFPCLWGGWGWGGGYGPPAYYGAPACGSPCGTGGCGYYRGYASGGCDPCACSPCGSPCGTGCATGACGVSYFDGRPVPDNGPAASGGKTYFDEQGNSATTPPAGEDDFQKPREGEYGPNKRSEGANPEAGAAPEGTTPEGATPDGDVLPGDTNALQPLRELDAVVTLRMAPVRTRLRIEAQYRLPHVARLTVEPQSPWLPVASERSIARK